MKITKLFLLLVVTIILLPGCSTKNTLTSTPSLSPSITRSVTPPPSQTGTVTPTSQPPSLTPTPTRQPLAITPTPTPLQTATPSTTASPLQTATPKTFVNQCLEVATSLPQNSKSSGVIVLYDYFSASPLYLLDMKTGKQTTLPQIEGENIESLVVSPDGKWLAYWSNRNRPAQVTLKNSWLVIATSDGKPYKLVPWQDGWRSVAGWLDQERVLVTRMPKKQYDPDSLVVVNPFSGEQVEFTPDYLYFNRSDWVDWNLSRMVFDPTLTRVIYTSFGEKLTAIALRDVNNKQLIASVPASLTCSPQPQWSVDGKQVFLTGLTSEKAWKAGSCNQELYSISRDGESTRLTYFTDAYTKVGIGSFSLSPDGQKIAFWLWLEANRVEQLATLDLATGEVTNTCVPGFSYGQAGPPTWSPDSQQLAVQNLNDDQNHSHTILVDLAQGWAARFAENLKPAGWMVSP